MGIKYEKSEELQRRVEHIATRLGRKIDFTRVTCVRSRGSAARNTLARCYTLPRVLQLALGVKAHYVIEVISERFDKMSEEEQIKTLIHEMMHIPKSMGGGFRHHDYVCRKNVEHMYRRLGKQ